MNPEEALKIWRGRNVKKTAAEVEERIIKSEQTKHERLAVEWLSKQINASQRDDVYSIDTISLAALLASVEVEANNRADSLMESYNKYVAGCKEMAEALMAALRYLPSPRLPDMEWLRVASLISNALVRHGGGIVECSSSSPEAANTARSSGADGGAAGRDDSDAF